MIQSKSVKSANNLVNYVHNKNNVRVVLLDII